MQNTHSRLRYGLGHESEEAREIKEVKLFLTLLS